jgi:hypothetical protein
MRPAPRPVRLLIVGLVASVALVGCTGQQADPGEYGDVNTENDGYYGNFMFGCTGVEANDDGEYVDVKLENPDFCTCVFEQMMQTVPFADAKAFDEAQADAEEGTEITIPSNIDSARESCADEASGPA